MFQNGAQQAPRLWSGWRVVPLPLFDSRMTSLRLAPPLLHPHRQGVDVTRELTELYSWVTPERLEIRPAGWAHVEIDPAGFVLYAEDVLVDLRGVHDRCGRSVALESCTTACFPQMRRGSGVPWHSPLGSTRNLTGTFVVAGPHVWGRGPYHHVLEEMSVAVQAMEVLAADPTSRLLLTRPSYATMYDYPRVLMGLGPDRVVYLEENDDGGGLRLERAFVPSGGLCGLPPHGRLARLREVSCAQAMLRDGTHSCWPPDDAPPRRRLVVLIRRGGAGPRAAWSNWASFVEAARGEFPHVEFEEHTPEMSVASVQRLYARAYAVVGPHGAGFVNLVFSRPGTRVLEIAPDKMGGAGHHQRYNGCYWWLCQALQLEHHLFQTPGTGRGFSEPLDVRAVIALLVQILE